MPLINPFTWIIGSPPKGWAHGLEFFWPVLAEGMLVSVALALIGCWLVVRGMSLLGDALAHSVLPGIVIGFLIGRSLQSIWIFVGATVIGMGAAALVQAVRDNSRVKEDASLGIVFTTLFALGVVMINVWAGQTDLDPGCVLYGQLEYFTPDRWEKILPMAGILVVLLVLLVAFYRHLLIATFDPLLAASQHIPAGAIHYGVMGALSLTTVASFEAVGAILVVALLVTPGSTARLWTDRMPVMLGLAACFAMLSTLVGYWLSHPAILNTSASGAITVAGFSLFLGSWLVSPRRGLLIQWRVRRRLRLRMADENLVKAVHELTSATPTASGPGIAASAVRQTLQVSRAMLSRAIRRTTSHGWLRSTGDRLALTPIGVQRAETLEHGHELWEQYLKQEIGLPADHLHDPAEWVEHYLSEERIEELKEAVRVEGRGQRAEDRK